MRRNKCLWGCFIRQDQARGTNKIAVPLPSEILLPSASPHSARSALRPLIRLVSRNLSCSIFYKNSWKHRVCNQAMKNPCGHPEKASSEQLPLFTFLRLIYIYVYLSLENKLHSLSKAVHFAKAESTIGIPQFGKKYNCIHQRHKYLRKRNFHSLQELKDSAVIVNSREPMEWLSGLTKHPEVGQN